MAEVISMDDIRAKADRLGVDLSAVNFDSIHLPPGEDFGIIRYFFIYLFGRN